MTDEQIAEIYSLARESFFGGQRSFQVQAYPFRMTPANFAKHRNNPNIPFWKMLKRGNDHFEVTGLEPKVDVCEKRYVFNAQQPANASRPLAFNPTGRCPVFEIPEDVLNALNEKQRQDEFQTAELIRRGVPAAPIRTGTDGGMHPVFLAKLKQQQREVLDNDGRVQPLAPVAAPGSLPTTVNPPREPDYQATGTVVTADVPVPRTAPQRKVGSAPAQTPTQVAAHSSETRSGLFGNLFTSNNSAQSSEGVFSRMGRMIGLRGAEQDVAPPPPPPKPKASAPRPAQTAAARPAAPQPRPAPQSEPAPREPVAQAPASQPGAVRPPAAVPSQEAAAPPPARPANSASLMSGAQPVVPSSSFDNRWSGLR
jgi:hypothetical protein